MAPSTSNAGTNNHKSTSITAINIASHLNAEKHFPAAKDLDLGLVRAWMRALNTGISKTGINFLAPKVLEELFDLEEVSVKDIAIYQQRHPIKRVAPVVTQFWPNPLAPVQRLKQEPVKVEDLSPDLQAFLVEKNIMVKKEGTRKTNQDNSGSEIEGERLIDLVMDSADGASEKAAKELKKAKKSAKKARKLIKALEKALPPTGKMNLEHEDDGNDSDWSKSSWNPSWASGQEDSEEL